MLNPDSLERDLRTTGRIDFAAWGLQVQSADLDTFFATHPLAQRRSIASPPVAGNVLSMGGMIPDPYLVAVLGDFMRRRWIDARSNFTFETVMSGPDKLDLLRAARDAGYRTYLYYICTDDPAINQERVAVRVSLGGHDVPPDKIISRYKGSLDALPAVVREASRAYLFDNSTPAHPHRLIAEYTDGSLTRIAQDLPNWYVTTLLPRSDSV